MASFRPQFVCATVLIALASPVSGQQAELNVNASSADLVVRNVGYADLNLASAPGEVRLNTRVGAAVRDLCTEATDGYGKNVVANGNMFRCTDRAWTIARPQIALAVERAHQIAATGSSALAAGTAIAISLSR